MNLFDTKAMKSRKARTKARVGHGPEGGAWISAFTRNGGRMKRVRKEDKRWEIKGSRVRVGRTLEMERSRGTRNRT
jgi:hypothetical protein